MAYSKEYFLLRVKQVNEIYLEHHKRGVTNEFIYKHHIQKQHCISRSTFYEYLTIPYAGELAKIQQRKAEQALRNPSLFD